MPRRLLLESKLVGAVVGEARLSKIAGTFKGASTIGSGIVSITIRSTGMGGRLEYLNSKSSMASNIEVM